LLFILQVIMSNHLNILQVEKATQALLTHIAKVQQEEIKQKNKKPLFDENIVQDCISLIISLKEIPSKAKPKPIRIPIPHPIFRETGNEVCLLVKDPQRKYKEMVKQANITCVTKVIGVSKLRKKYMSFEAKRTLCHSYDIFIADKAILPFLPRLLGKKFFKMKRQPIPINASGSGESLKKEIDHARDSTYLFINSGPCCAVKIANTNFDKEVIVENIIKGMENIAKMIPKHWRNIQSIHIKTSNSVALPIYNSLPNAAIKILSNKKKVNQPKNNQDTVTEMETKDIDLKPRDKKKKKKCG